MLFFCINCSSSCTMACILGEETSSDKSAASLPYSISDVFRFLSLLPSILFAQNFYHLFSGNILSQQRERDRIFSGCSILIYLSFHTIKLYFPFTLLFDKYNCQVQKHIFIVAVPEFYGNITFSIFNLFLIGF